MSSEAKELKHIRREQFKAANEAKIKENRNKIRECLKAGDTKGADYYSALNKKLREMIAC